MALFHAEGYDSIQVNKPFKINTFIFAGRSKNLDVKSPVIVYSLTAIKSGYLLIRYGNTIYGNPEYVKHCTIKYRYIKYRKSNPIQ